MNKDSYKIFPLGDNALTIEFGNRIDVELNDRAIRLAEYITLNPFPSLIEAVPAYASVSIFYRLQEVCRAAPSDTTMFQFVRDLVERALTELAAAADSDKHVVEIPVRFDEECALDLERAAELKHLSPDQFVEIFLSKIYRVYMLGFLPGFAYMGEVDTRIAVPRKETPRLSVPKGSVGIAGNQTGIYPLASPGGWQIIGRTAVELFTPEAEIPCLLRPGDTIRFIRSL